jgi:hypothetical protein
MKTRLAWMSLLLASCYLSHGHEISARDAQVARDAPDARVAVDAYTPTTCSSEFQSIPVEVGREASPIMHVDATGMVHIVYCRPYEDIRHAYGRPPGAWTIELVAQDEDLSGRCSFALDAAGAAHVCYSTLGHRSASDTAITYSHREAEAWTIEVIDATGAFACTLATDSSGTPHMIEGFWGGGGLGYRHLWRPLGAWSWMRETLEVETEASANSPALFIDEDDTLHVAYAPLNASATGMTYAQLRPGGTWAFERLDGIENRASGISIAARGGVVHAVFHDASMRGLGSVRYARRELDGSWSITVLDPDVGMLDATSEAQTGIDLSADGMVHVTYSNRGELRYARLEAGTWSTTIVDTHPSGAIDSSLVVEPGRVHVTYSGRWLVAENPFRYAFACPR